MLKKLLFSGIMLVVIAVSGVALAAHGKAGLWNVTMTMTMANMPQMPQIPPEAMAQMRARGITIPQMGGQSISSQRCMTQAEVAADKPPRTFREDSGCDWNNANTSGSSMSAEMVCSGQMKGTGTVHVSYDGPDHYRGEYSFKGSMDGHPVDMKTTFRGDWVKADCGAMKPVMQ